MNMKKAPLLAFATLFLVVAEVHSMENPIREPEIRVEKLSNGLTVFLLEDHSVPLVAVDVNYHVGAKNEKVGRTGFAHLFEHLMFQGSQNYNDDYFKPLQDIGGQVNGATSTDRTRYWEVVPAGYLERALWLEADRMGFLLEATDQERLDNQRSVVQNERRQNYDNRPYGTVWEQLLAVLYPPNHPYSWPTIGYMDDIAAATLKDVQEFFKTYYSPNNASIALVGDFNSDEALKLIDRYFGAIPPGPPVSRIASWVPTLEKDVVLEIQDRVQLPRTYKAWMSVPLYNEDDAALDVLAQIIGGGKTSRLYKELVQERQIAQEVYTFHNSSQISGVFLMLLTPRPDRDLSELEEAAQNIVDQVIAKGITKAELERAQNAILADYVRSMQNIGGFGGLADQMNSYYHYLGAPNKFRWDLQRYLDLKPADINRVAKQYLVANSATARVRPLPSIAPSTSDAATTLDRSVMPEKGRENPFTLPARQEFHLENGLRVVHVPDSRLPLATAVLIMPGGAAADPKGLAGMSSMTTSLLREGAAGKTSQQIAQLMENLGTIIDTSTSPEAAIVSMSTLTTNIKSSFQLMADLVVRPDFPPQELERKRAERLVNLSRLQDQPATVARMVGQKAVFGDHPYGDPMSGTPDSLKAISRDDIVQFWKRIFVPNNATLIVVGDVQLDDLKKLAQGAFGSWPKGEKPSLELPEPAPLTHGRTIYLVNRPKAVQSNILVGGLGTTRQDENIPVIDVMNNALGGSFVSRLNLNLREDKGYTYGARTRFEHGNKPGIFAAMAPVQANATVESIRETLKEIDDIASSRPLVGPELKYAIDSIVNSYAARFATANNVANELIDLYLYGLPLDYVESYPIKVAAVTADDVTAVAKKVLSTKNMVIVVVGDRDSLIDGLKELGPVIEVDWLGMPLK
ncbi:MAG: M16 family metallopeptidase [Myxococcota bacterium]|jgi:zinc protease|nr:insulinase family protein [Myxococcota bacterium]MBP8971249.1 insulinase family protein [Myxococcota bacterium]HHW95822.1 insulinase family protein [Oligoflexales bacterium]HQL56042.1 pitrilysin family protein [Myxococcota bacterium]